MVVVTVDGESAESTAFDKDERVAMGGKAGGGYFGGDMLCGLGGLCGGEICPLIWSLAWEEAVCGLPNPLKEPKEPDNRFEKLPLLFAFADDMLEAVDWDQRFRFPSPSLFPCLLSGRV